MVRRVRTFRVSHVRKSPFGNVQVAAHEVPSTANQVSTLCRPESMRPARALPSRRSRSSAVEIRDDVAWRENSAEISVRVIPFGPAALEGILDRVSDVVAKRSPKICVALSSQKSQTASAASRWGVSIWVLLSSAA